MATNDSKQTPLMYLKHQPQLYDLHTHLMGMGSAHFWIDSIILDPSVMPDKATFKNEEIRKTFCPLVWDENNFGFVDGDKTVKFFDELVQRNTLPFGSDEEKDREEDYFKNAEYSPALTKLLENKKFTGELIHRRLNFREDFSYDVVLKLTDLGHALGIEDTYLDFIQATVSERLGLYSKASVKRQKTEEEEEKIRFRHWIVFDAREQCFAVRYGILLAELRSLIQYSPSGPTKAQQAARAHIHNAFSMCNADGSPARHVDLHGFQGSFTPKFYPQRFALKDSIYSQRLDVLARLIEHIIERYTTCIPKILYCEFSVSVRDLTRPWVYDVLRSVQHYEGDEQQLKELRRKKEISSFWFFVHSGKFPHLTFTSREMYRFNYKFLAGFDRQQTKLPTNHTDDNPELKKTFALSLLHDYPQHAICFMMDEMIKSMKEKNGEQQSTVNNGEYDGPFIEFFNKLKNLQNVNNYGMPSFYDWIVGIDLFGDELGYPYCPFVIRPFIKFIEERREYNPNFGVRVHCGENVPYAPADAPAYRLFITHMYIVFCCLRFLKQELKSGIRIGHGIAFDRLLEEKDDEHMCRKSSVLRAEMRHHARQLFEAIAFEVNLTSNEYLLGQSVRNRENDRVLCLDTLEKLGAPVILATDDDGIWPIDACESKHPGHQSLAAEYCRAISSGLIKSTNQLKSMFINTKKFCFTAFKTAEDRLEPTHEENFLTVNSSHYPFVVHPDIVRQLHQLYKDKNEPVHLALERIVRDENQPHPSWISLYGIVRVAFICLVDAFNHIQHGQSTDERTIQTEYMKLFQSDNAEREFPLIWKNWSEISMSFVYFHKQSEENQEKLEYQKVLVHIDKQNQMYFYSPSVEKNLTEKVHQQFYEFLRNIQYCEVPVNAYMPHTNTADLVAKFNQTEDRGKQMIVNIYTNRNKEVFVYHPQTKNIHLKINDGTFDQRLKNDNFIYVISRHGSAATAALHYLAKHIKETIPDRPVEPVEADSSPSDVFLATEVDDAVNAAVKTSSVPMDGVQESIRNGTSPLLSSTTTCPFPENQRDKSN